MGGSADVDYFGEGDMDTPVFAIDWVASMALSQASNDEREVATESASVCGYDCGDRVGGWCCGFYCFGYIERPGGSSTPFACT
jgi:hypothetical protein